MDWWRKPDKWRHSPWGLSTSTHPVASEQDDKDECEGRSQMHRHDSGSQAGGRRIISDFLEKIQDAISSKSDRGFNWAGG